MTAFVIIAALAIVASHAAVWARNVWSEARCRDGQCARCWGSAWRLR